MIRGLGVDLATISRIGGVLERSGDAFLRRVFTEGERAYALSFSEPARPLAARFAAKEAAVKALGGWVPKMAWLDLEVVKDAHGAPKLVLHGAAGDRARELGATVAHLSLSHEGDTAIAFVILEG